MNVVIAFLLAAITSTSTPPVRPTDAAAPPAPADKVPVFLQSEIHDGVGAVYVARLREALEESRLYRPVANPSSARFVVGIVTMDPNEDESGPGAGRSTVAAVTLQRENADGLNEFVYSWVLVARREKVDALVGDLVTAIGQEIQTLEKQPVIRFVD